MRKGAPRFRLLGCEAALQEARTRMPFRYGNACLTAAPSLLVRLRIEGANGKQAVGLAGDALPPRWFDKDPAKSFRRNVEDQLAAFEKARDIYLILGEAPRTAGDLWREAHPRIMEEGSLSHLTPLTRAFGGSFLERAMVDALARWKGVSFFEALKQDLIGLGVSASLPAKPLEALVCRHTVGLGDPITVGEIPPAERLNDGLPQALEEDIESYGLRSFKIKVAGDHARDIDRLSRMAALLHQRCRRGYRITLDGNEQYADLKDLERLLDALAAKPYGKEFLGAILFIEQPLPRDAALDPARGDDVARLAARRPLTIDESDDDLGAFERAVGLGYRGVSHKNCKGIFKSLLHRAFIAGWNREHADSPCFQTGEDLTNLPVVPLQEDLASLATLGIEHAERNGHHYYRGLDHLPRTEAAGALAAHPDLYEERQDSVFLRIQDGMIRMESIQAPGYGYSSGIAFEERTPLEKWSFDRLEALEEAQKEGTA
jgi:L-alanine-DL-glutamate epimerase-like enolase superfamily enzyme